MALGTLRRSLASLPGRAAHVAAQQRWAAPMSYSTVRAIVAALDPAMLTLAHDGAVALRDTYELVYRASIRASQRDVAGRTPSSTPGLSSRPPVRPWLTVVLDAPFPGGPRVHRRTRRTVGAEHVFVSAAGDLGQV